jgi:hypothetical protein
LMVVTASPKTRATSPMGAPSSTISRTTRSRSSTGCVLGFPAPRLDPGPVLLPDPPRFVPSCLLIPSSLPGRPRQPEREDGAR